MESKTPNPREFERGVLAFREREPRDAMYRVATLLVKQFWREPSDLADGIGVLLLTWNQAHYRYGAPDFKRFEVFLSVNRQVFDQLRSRDISTFTSGDQQGTLEVFASALEALAIAEGK